MSRTKDKNIETLGDDGGIVEKAFGGNLGKMDGVDVVEGLRYGTGFIPVADPALATVQGLMEEEKYREKYRRRLGNLSYVEHRSPGFKRKMKELRHRGGSRLAEALVSSAGAIAGTAAAASAAAALAITGPVGWGIGLTGLLGGGLLADKAYHKAFPTENQDVMQAVGTIERLQRDGQEVHPAMVLDAMVANARDRTGKAIEDKLEDETGVRQFAAALSDPDNKHKMARLMRRTGRMAEAEHYAALLNNGEMKASDLLDLDSFNMKRDHQLLLAGRPVEPEIPTPGLPLAAHRGDVREV